MPEKGFEQTFRSEGEKGREVPSYQSCCMHGHVRDTMGTGYPLCSPMLYSCSITLGFQNSF